MGNKSNDAIFESLEKEFTSAIVRHPNAPFTRGKLIDMRVGRSRQNHQRGQEFPRLMDTNSDPSTRNAQTMDTSVPTYSWRGEDFTRDVL